ncbi:hypothetical protein HU200_067684 [Digitaria exilis]|uniref:Bifunctional inhibitor/plant lipid transfer protein/seed storage helical domain-containing protein n=1 Tax=Digitaria exilis TaxID=1010633 RepID=A0A834ZW68_9POAL|nr:hypothetical protein HU200_067684 [Digitaria exilis]
MLVLAVGVSVQVTGVKNIGCRNSEKQRILHDCARLLRHDDLPIIVGRDSLCCCAVRAVPHKNMTCIAGLLTDAEKKLHSADKIQRLEPLC